VNITHHMQHWVIKSNCSGFEIMMLLTVLHWQLTGLVSGRRSFQHAASCSTRYPQDFFHSNKSLACSLCMTLT